MYVYKIMNLGWLDSLTAQEPKFTNADWQTINTANNVLTDTINSYLSHYPSKTLGNNHGRRTYTYMVHHDMNQQFNILLYLHL